MSHNIEMDQFYTLQKELDDHIFRNHPKVQTEPIDMYLLSAFRIELAEFLNEHRHFKFWSNRRTCKDRQLMIEEATDAFHFLLSLGLKKRFNSHMKHKQLRELSQYKGKRDPKRVYQYANYLFENMIRYRTDYQKACSDFMAMCYHAGITDQELADAYMKKNQVNHERQKEGY